MDEIEFQIRKIREVVRKFLTKEAAERLNRVRLVKPQLALEVELNLFKLEKYCC